MVYRHINTDLKHRILLLIERGRTSEELCDLFGISLRSLDRWLTNFEQYGSAARPSSHTQGQPPSGLGALIGPLDVT